jgi:hypothetical protein
VTKSSVSKYIFLIEACVPLLVVVGFLLDRQLSQILYAFGYDPSAVPHFWFLVDQYEFFEKYFPGKLVVGDLHVFELFVWLALLLAALRIVSGLFSLELFEPVYARLKQLNFSLYKYLTFVLLVAPLAIIVSTNVGWTSRVPQFAQIIEHSVRAFLCLEAFVFCGGVFFFTEGMLFSLWLIFKRERVDLRLNARE